MALSLKKRITNILSRERVNEKGVFLKRIGTLLEEGYSIKDALEFLVKIEKGHVKEWVGEIHKGMLAGYSFHEELEKVGFSSKSLFADLFSYALWELWRNDFEMWRTVVS